MLRNNGNESEPRNRGTESRHGIAQPVKDFLSVTISVTIRPRTSTMTLAGL